MYVLDTDITSFYSRGQFPLLNHRIDESPSGTLFVAITTVSERIKPSLGDLNNDKLGRASLDESAEHLRIAFETLGRFQILPCDEDARAILSKIKNSVFQEIRGKSDAIIASIAVANKMTVITNNTRHFQVLKDVMGVEYENWTLP